MVIPFRRHENVTISLASMKADFMMAFPGGRKNTGRGLAAAAMCLALTVCAAIAVPARQATAATCAQAQLSAGGVQAVKLARRGELSRALAAARGDAAARKAAQWLWLQAHLKRASAAELLNFANANPRWPQAGAFRALGELKLLLNGSQAGLAAYFAKHRPVTASGKAALAKLLLARGEREKARALLKAAWRHPRLSAAAESYIRRNMHQLLTRADDAARLWRLIMAQRTRHAVRFARNMPSAYRQAAAAARALMLRRRGAVAAYRRLPASMRNTQALRYALARYYRRTDRPLKALAILKGVPASHARQIMPEQWWEEKRLLARRLLRLRYRRHWRDAYRLAASHGFASPGKASFRGEFLAGFIALEKLHDAKTALKHFLRLPKLAKSRTWKSKGWYWVGRAREALGDIDGARRAYRAAATTPTVYYGLLAREKLGLGRRPLPLKMAWPTPDTRCKVGAHELMRAARYLAAAGEKRRVRAFVWPLAYSFHKAPELAAAASWLWDISGPANAVRLAKAAGSRGIDIDNYGYPVKALPKHRTRENILELPVVLAITRQESEFDPHAGSHAGAHGLMQLMPSTARIEARVLGVSYRRGWLKSRPDYNLLLGRHHLARIMQNFGGSYALAFAAYNAGAGNVRKWLKEYGDMRTGSPDPVEWVELIPFTETRNYVQKVLQGTHVYRTRLKRPMLPISRDLWRGVPGWRELVLRGGGRKVKQTADKPRPRETASRETPVKGCAAGAKGIGDLIGKC